MSDKDNCYQDQLARMKMLDTSKKTQEAAKEDNAVVGFVAPGFEPPYVLDNLPYNCGITISPNWSEEDQEAMRLSLDTSKVEFTSFPEGITLETHDCLQTLIGKVVRWHYDRNLIDGSTDKDQTLKLMQELGELSDSVCKGKDIKDDIGDMLVVMLNITERNGVSLAECLERAWDEIKDRKGRMVDGVFVKEGDL
jgi:hypothetical protein